MFKNGFTLIELIVTTAIIVIVVTIAFDYIIQSQKTSNFAQEMEEANYNARNALNLLVREIRESNRSDMNSYPINIANPQELIFYSDIDKDIAVEKVRYFLDDTTIKRGVTEPTGDPLAYLPENEVISDAVLFLNNGESPIFTYFDENGNQISDIPFIRLVHINLKINVHPERAPRDFELNSDILLRNLQ